MRSFIDSIFKPAPAPAPVLEATAPAPVVPPAVQEAFDAEASLRTETEAAAADLETATARVDAARAVVAEGEGRLAELEAMLEPTPETLLDEAKTRRRLVQLRAALAEAEAALASAGVRLESTNRRLAKAVEARVWAEVSHEASVIVAEVDAFARVMERRHAAHVERCREARVQTYVSEVPPTTNSRWDDARTGFVGLASHVNWRRYNQHHLEPAKD